MLQVGRAYGGRRPQRRKLTGHDEKNHQQQSQP